ncbi:MAG: glycosyltransferase family 4 protein [Nibricoccus sp.]
MTDEPPEIVILNDYASPTGGSSAVAIASAIGLAEQGFPVTYFSCVSPIAPQLQGKTNLRVVCLKQSDIGKSSSRAKAGFSGIRNARAVAALRAILAPKSREKTIVHAHTWSQALSPFALTAATDLGFRLVITLHDFFTACPNGQFFVYPRKEICQRKPLSFACWRCNCDRRHFGHKLWRNARMALQTNILRVPAKTSYFIGVSDFSLNILRPHLPASIPARVIHNPVDCEQLTPAPVAENQDFFFVGRFEQEKGALLFAQAVEAAGANATFVGDGSLLPALRAACPRGRFSGWLPPEKLRAHLQTARALVFPSLWYETLGLVAIEALALGVPVIVSDRGAATDFVSHGVNGLHFSHGSAQALAAQILALKNDSQFAARLGRAGYDGYWQDPWTVTRHVNKLIDIYNTVSEPIPSEIPKGDYYESTGGIRTRG